MRYGICGNLIGTENDKTGISHIDFIKECGYDYVELPLSETMELSQSARQALVSRLDSSGLKSEVMNNFFPRHLKLTGDQVNRDEIRRYYEAAMPVAKRLGAVYIVFGSPFAKSYPLGYDAALARAQLDDLTVELDHFARDVGLRILIEPIHPFEANLINSISEAVSQVQLLSLQATDVLADYYHMVRAGDPVSNLQKAGAQYIRHIHWACPFYPGEGERVFPLNVAEWPYGELVHALQKIGYGQRISIEARTSNIKSHARQSLAVLKQLFQDGGSNG